jgi:hypothetical protein
MVGCKIVILLHTQLLAQKVQRGKLFALHAPDGESFRGINAVRLLLVKAKYTLDKVIADGYDMKLSILRC